MSDRRTGKRKAAVVLAAAVGATFGPAGAALAANGNTVYNWQGPGGSFITPTTGNWSTNTNWDIGTPASGANTELDFGGTGTTAYSSNDDIANAFTLNQITLNSAASVAETIGIATPAPTPAPTLTFVTNTQATPATPSIVQSNTGAFTIAIPVTNTNNLTLARGGSVTNATAGAVTLSGAFTNTGGLTVTGGNYTASSTFANAGGISVTGGNFTASGVVSGAGAIAVSGGGSLNLTGTANTFTVSSVTVDGTGSNLTLQSGGSFGLSPGTTAAGNPANRTLALTNGGQFTLNTSYDLNVVNGNFPIISIGTGGGILNQVAGAP